MGAVENLKSGQKSKWVFSAVGSERGETGKKCVLFEHANWERNRPFEVRADDSLLGFREPFALFCSSKTKGRAVFASAHLSLSPLPFSVLSTLFRFLHRCVAALNETAK
ncbi:hypothetical protein ACLOJK_027902 [Asimina triloba]